MSTLRLRLELQPRRVQLRALAVPDGHDEVRADEHVDLAGLDGVLGVDVPERLEHQEQRVLVALQLGPLVGVDRVLDGEVVQPEGDRHVLQLHLGWARAGRATRSRRHPSRGSGARAGRSGRSPRAPGRPCGRGRCRRSPAEVNPVTLADMATVILLRHGRTTANATGVLAGRSKGCTSTTWVVPRPSGPVTGSPRYGWPASSPARSSAAGRPRPRWPRARHRRSRSAPSAACSSATTATGPAAR